jgi:Ala-tRNA(Pro) deacylase
MTSGGPATASLLAFLAQQGIAFEHCAHPAVFTCEESERLVPKLPGAKTKNLFVTDKKGRRHFLLVVPQEARVDLAALSDRLAVKGLRFASEERLLDRLGITPGAVSFLALINDRERVVEPYFEASIWAADAIQAHPLENTATVVIPKAGVERFLAATGHVASVLSVPAADA